MAEAEDFAAFLGEGTEGFLFEARGLSEEDLQTKFKSYQSNFKEGKVKEFFGDSGFTKISREDGQIKFENSENPPKSFTEKNFRDAFEGSFDPVEPPDMRTFLDKLTGDNSFTDSPEFEKFETAQNNLFKEKPFVKQLDALEKAAQDTKNTPIPKDAAEMEKTMADKGWTFKDYAGTFGTWLEVALVAGGLDYLYTTIEKHKNAMNGCWLINTKDGSKTKVDVLTCNKDCTGSPADGYKIAPYCEDWLGPPNLSPSGGTSGSGGNVAPNCTVDSFVPAFQTSYLGLKVPLTNYKLENPWPGVYSSTGKVQCAYTPKTSVTCVDPAKACPDKSSSCSSMCDSSLFPLRPGYILKCVDVDFWGALGDLNPASVSGISSALSSIVKWLLYGLLIIGVLILAYFIITKGIPWIFKEINEKDGAED